MKSPIFTVKDNLVGFNSPYIRMNERVAIREFRTMIDDLDDKGDHSVFDLGLYCVGTFDLETGVIESHDPQVVLLATQCLTLSPKEVGDIDD